ncbi:MAG TPA: hypothetical protein VLJ59_18360 [Mycobacteriales bacterium]|nr:hypothetical protein [Mycobacteriales bacterium]
MDLHHDDSSFDDSAFDAGEVHGMYLPGTQDGVGQDHTADHAEPASHNEETVSVRVSGQEVTAPATVDVDHDGRNETALVGDATGHHVAISDLDHDGAADHAALLDDSGQVVGTAHLDRNGGRWVDDRPGDSTPYPKGAALGSGAGTGSGGHTITVDLGGQETELPVTAGSGHDGAGDTAVVDAPGGNKIAFIDTDGDGRADEATIFDRGGAALGSAHYDEPSGTWVEGACPDARPSGGGLPAGHSLNHDGRDGRDEIAVVEGSDGTTIAFTDTDGDGSADHATVFDHAGNLVGTARYNPSAGSWVEVAAP